MYRLLCVIYYWDQQMHNIKKVRYEIDITKNILGNGWSK